MAIRINDNLIADIDLRDLVGESDERIFEILAEEMQNSSPSEVEEAKEELKERIKEIEGELLALVEKYEEELDEARDTDDIRDDVIAQKSLEDVTELLNELDSIDENILDAANQMTLRHIDATDHTLFNYDTNETNRTIQDDYFTIIPRSVEAQSGVFGGDPETQATEEDTDYTNSTDFDPDAILEDATSSRGQEIRIQINPTDQITAIQEIGTTKIFTITTADSKTFQIEVQNVVPGKVAIVFEGSNFMSQALVNNMSTDLQKSCYENADTRSYHHILTGEDPYALPEVETPEELFNVEGTINQVNSWIQETYDRNPNRTYNSIGTARLTQSDAELLQDFIEIIYDSQFYDTSSDYSLDDAMVQVAELLATLPAEKQSTLVGALVTHIYANDNANFETIFGGYGEYVKSILIWYNSGDEKNQNAFEKMIINILEPGYIAGLPENTDTWENLNALQWQQGLIAGVDPIESASLDDAINTMSARRADEQDVQETENEYQDEIDNVTDAIESQGHMLAKLARDLGFSSVTNEKMDSLMAFYESLLTVPKEEFEAKIREFFDDMDGGSDNFAAIFLHFTGTYCPKLMAHIKGSTGSSIRSYLRGLIDNGEVTFGQDHANAAAWAAPVYNVVLFHATPAINEILGGDGMNALSYLD